MIWARVRRNYPEGMRSMNSKIDPWWSQGIDQRVGVCGNSTALKVAYFYPCPSPSTFRYRVYNMIEALERSGRSDVVATWFHMGEINELLSVLGSIDVLVLVRTPFDEQIADIIARARMLRVKLIFDCDDLVFDPKYAHLGAVNNALPLNDGSQMDKWYASVARLNATAQHCDAGIATNSYLAEMLSRVVSGPVFIVRNFLNKRQEDVSAVLLSERCSEIPNFDENFTIGYFSGSKTHKSDFELVSDALIDALETYKQVTLKLVGFVDLPVSFMRFLDRLQILDYVNWIDLQRQISSVDLNIAPLQVNHFSNSKSELKYFEAAVVGTYSCVANTYSYRSSIPSIDLGCVVTDGDWSSAIFHSLEHVLSASTCSSRQDLSRYAIEKWSSASVGFELAEKLLLINNQLS